MKIQAKLPDWYPNPSIDSEVERFVEYHIENNYSDGQIESIKSNYNDLKQGFARLIKVLAGKQLSASEVFFIVTGMKDEEAKFIP